MATLVAQQIELVDPANEMAPTGKTPSVCRTLDNTPGFLFWLFSLLTHLMVNLLAALVVGVIVPAWDDNWD